MTREEAIGRILEHIMVHKIGQYPHLKIGEALEMAIAALCTQQCENAQYPCIGCESGWGSASANGVTTCKDSCEKLAAYMAQQERENPKPITNADRIRSMSDEELASWIDEWSFCADVCPASTNEVEEAIGYRCPQNCKEQALKWLQQPAEENAQ